VSRPRGARPTLGVAALGVGLLLAGCAGAARPTAARTAAPSPSADPTATPHVHRPARHRATASPAVPSPAATATATAVASRPPTVPPCAAGQLAAGMPHISAGTGGQQAAFVELRNSGTWSCALTGYPGLALLGPGGRPMHAHVADEALFPVRYVLLPAGTGAIIPGRPSQGHAYVMVLFNTYDSPSGLCSAGQIERPVALALTLPGSHTVLRVPSHASDGSGKGVASCHGQIGVTPVGTLTEANDG
jgi:hypothetical protein